MSYFWGMKNFISMTLGNICLSTLVYATEKGAENCPKALAQLPDRMRGVGYFKSLPIDHPDALQDLDLPIPEVGANDLLVEIHAVSMNPVDAKQRVRSESSDGPPRVLGYDAAGVVKKVGSKVSGFQEGDRVFYAGDLTRMGSNSEFHAVDHRIVGHLSESISFEQGAALPLTSLTAYEALFDRLLIDENGSGVQKTLLVIGGAGGVGSMAIQLAKMAGLRVIATASRDDSHAWVKRLGADFSIDHRNNLAEEVKKIGLEGVDYILNAADTEQYWSQMAEVINPQGRIVSIVEANNPLDLMLLAKKSASFSFEFMFTRSMFQTKDIARQSEILTKVSRLFADGKLQSPVGLTLSPINSENLRKAHQVIESRRSIGKIVVSKWPQKKRPEIYRVNAFTLTSGVEGGNPAGVVLNADELSDSEKQEMAREIGYSETAFVSSSDIAGFKLDFFTPTKQIPDCGHATIAAFSVLASKQPNLGATSKEILGGKTRDISIRHGKVFMSQPAAVVSEDNLTEAQELFENQPQFRSGVIARADNGFLVLEVASESELAHLRPRQDKILAYSEKNGLVGLYIYTSSKSAPAQYATRMFAPAYGINEESATGVAAGLLSSVLHAKGLGSQFVIDQGLWMNPVRPSRIWTQVSSDEGRVEVGGYATVE